MHLLVIYLNYVGFQFPKPITKSINLSVLTGFNKIQKKKKKFKTLLQQHEIGETTFLCWNPIPSSFCVCLFLKKKKKSGLIITNENENFLTLS